MTNHERQLGKPEISNSTVFNQFLFEALQSREIDQNNAERAIAYLQLRGHDTPEHHGITASYNFAPRLPIYPALRLPSDFEAIDPVEQLSIEFIEGTPWRCRTGAARDTDEVVFVYPETHDIPSHMTSVNDPRIISMADLNLLVQSTPRARMHFFKALYWQYQAGLTPADLSENDMEVIMKSMTNVALTSRPDQGITESKVIHVYFSGPRRGRRV